MSCELCGSRCHGRRCSSCEQIASAEDQVADTEAFECPNCGGTTSGEGVDCYRCRGSDDSDDNAHANSVNAQLRQAERDGDLPDWLREKHGLDEEDDEEEDGEDDE